MFLIKNVIVFFIFAIGCSAYAEMTAENYKNVGEQFSNRNWELYAADSLRKAHFLDFDNSEILNKMKNLYKSVELKFKNIVNQEFDSLDLTLFYPQIQMATNADAVKESVVFTDYISLYTILDNWGDLFSALGEERWNDLEGCSGNILTNVNCGRATKVNYILQYLSQERRQKLEILKGTLTSEIRYAGSLNLNLNYDTSLVNLFQFLNYQSLFGSIINPNFLNSGSNIAAREKLFVESMRAIIVQVFQVDGGKLITSDLEEIVVEPDECDSSCLYNYYRKLMYSPSNDGTQITNLIFDQKFISPLLAYYLSLNNDSDRDKFLSEINLFLKDVLDFDVNDPLLPEKDRLLVRTFLESTVDNILNSPNVQSLKLAKKIEYFLKGWGNE